MNIRWTIGRKLSLGIGCTLLLMGIIIAVGVGNITAVHQSADEILDEFIEIDRIQELRLSVQQLLMPANDHLIHGDESEFYNFEKLLNKTKGYLSECRIVVGDEREKKALDKFEEKLLKIEFFSREIFSLDIPGGKTRGAELMEKMDTEGDKATSILNEAFQVAREEMKREEEESHAAKNTAVHIMVALGLFMMFIGLTGGVSFTRTITGSIKKLLQATQKVAKGDLFVKIESTSDDEIGDLAVSFNKMTGDLKTTTTSIDKLNMEIFERQRAEEKLQRSSEAQVAVNKLLRMSLENTSLKEILEKALEYILSIPWLTLESKGAIFLSDLETKELVMMTQKGLSKELLAICARVPFGRCLCGKAALSEKPVFAEHIDKRHENRYEGIKPHGHYCAPIASGSGEILGVINLYLAEGHHLAEREEDFVRVITNVLAGIISREKIEEALRTANLFNKALLDSIPFGMDIVDEEGTILFVNDNLASVFDRHAVGKKCWELYKDDEKQCNGCPLKEGIKIGEVESIEVEGCFGDRSLQITHVGMFYKGKKAVLEVFQDITERKETERRTKEAVEMKSDFVSMVSHELRTPLTSIKEGIDIVLDGTAGTLKKEQDRFLNIAKRNVDRLARLINNVLDFQKIESGKMEFEIKKNDVNKVVEDMQVTMAPLVKEKGLEFIINLEKKLPKIDFDEDKITQVLTNLVNNALKFTVKGSVTIATAIKADNFICVSVRDTGYGIGKKDMERLFQKFGQLDKGINRMTGGTGLGLAISKDIIEKHNGKIWAESKKGKGLVFYFTLPIKSKKEKGK